MSSPPENPFSSGDTDDNNRFDAFQLSPDKTSSRSSLPSLQSIQAAQQQQQMQQQQQQRGAPSSSQQQSTFDSLPSPEELQGPISSTTNNNNDWIPQPSSTANNNINSGINNDNNQQSSSSILPKFLTCGGALSIESLRPYFDVDTADIILRMKSSIKYCNVPDGFRNEVLYSDNAMRLAYRETPAAGGEGGETTTAGASTSSSSEATSVGNVGGGGEGKGPDLYGPTWITMTLVFFLAVTSNLSLYFHHSGKQYQSLVDEGGVAAEEEWDYDINQLLHATWILYSFSFLLPMGLYLMFRLMGIISFSMVDLICFYGYSLVAYIPTTWICVAPVSWLQWLSLCISTVVSGMLVLRNVTGPILESAGGGGGVGQGKSGGLIMAVIGCHFIFFLVMKLAFYHHVHH